MSCLDTPHPLKLCSEAGSKRGEVVARGAATPPGPARADGVPDAGPHPAERLSGVCGTAPETRLFIKTWGFVIVCTHKGGGRNPVQRTVPEAEAPRGAVREAFRRVPY